MTTGMKLLWIRTSCVTSLINEPTSSIKGVVFLDYVSDYWFLNKVSASLTCMEQSPSSEVYLCEIGLQGDTL